MDTKKILNENTTICIMGQKGSGKTYLGAILANLFEGKALILDTVGVYTQNRLIGGSVAYIQVSTMPYDQLKQLLDNAFNSVDKVVIDLSYYIPKELSVIGDFLSNYALFMNKDKNLLFLVDEIGDYCPQSFRNYSDNMERLVRVGRNKGVKPFIMITQRPQKTNKELLALSDIYYIFRIVHNLDREQVKNLLGMSKDEWEAYNKKVTYLKTREVYVYDAVEHTFVRWKTPKMELEHVDR